MKKGEKVGHLKYQFFDKIKCKDNYSTQLNLFSTSFVITRYHTHCVHVRLVYLKWKVWAWVLKYTFLFNIVCVIWLCGGGGVNVAAQHIFAMGYIHIHIHIYIHITIHINMTIYIREGGSNGVLFWNVYFTPFPF